MGIQIEFAPILGDTVCLALPNTGLYPVRVFQVIYQAVPALVGGHGAHALVANEQQVSVQVLEEHVALSVVLNTRREAGELLQAEVGL